MCDGLSDIRAFARLQKPRMAHPSNIPGCRPAGTPIGYKSILTSSRAALLERGMLEEKRAEVGTFFCLILLFGLLGAHVDDGTGPPER